MSRIRVRRLGALLEDAMVRGCGGGVLVACAQNGKTD